MLGIDLNASPTEDEVFYDTEPQFCTQATPEIVEESPYPLQQDNVADGGDSAVHSAQQKRAQAHTTRSGGDSIPTSTMPTESTTYPDMGGGDADGGGKQEEVISSPSEPFLGM
jgi:hypothetical protein